MFNFYFIFTIIISNYVFGQFPSFVSLVQNDPTFELVGPFNLTVPYTQMMIGRNFIGNNADQSLLIARAVTSVDAGNYGCDPFPPYLPDGTSWNGTLVFVYRGGTCAPQQKAQNIINSGALAWMQSTCNPGPPTFCATSKNTAIIWRTQMANWNWDIQAISVANILYSDIYKFIESMNKNFSQVFTAYIPATGPLKDPEELKAVEAFSNSYYIDPINDATGTIPIQDWKNIRSDPCVGRRISIFICRFGHVVGIWHFLSPFIIDQIPKEINLFTQLEDFAVYSTATFKNTVIPDMSNCTKLKTLVAYNLKQPLQFPSVEKLTQLSVIDFSYTPIGKLPDGIGNLNKLQLFWAPKCGLTSIPVFVSPELFWFDINSNAISSNTLPLSKKMKYLNIGYNNFQLNSIETIFDNSMIEAINLSNNQISGNVPNFSNVSITYINIKNNKFIGGFPLSWNKPSLTYIDASNNQLTGPFDLTMTSCTDVILSNNQLDPGDKTLWPKNNGDWALVMKTALPGTLNNLYLDKNRIKGLWPQAQFWGSLNFLITLNLAYNNLTSLPVDLGFGKSFVNLDVSFNQLKGDIPNIDLMPSQKTINLQGNPNLRSTTKNLPSWASQLTTVLIKTSNTDSYQCPEIIPAPGNTLKLTVDATYYYYKNCACDRGYYQSPPDCLNIPSTVQTQKNDSKLSDYTYGSNRLISGMDLTWIIVAPPQTESCIINFNVQLYPEFQIVNPEFKDEPNKITISSECPPGTSFNPIENTCSCVGGKGFSYSSLKCEDVKIQIQNTNFIIDSSQNFIDFQKYTIINKFATLNFKSKKISGNHMNFNFSFVYDCPIGYTYFKNQQDQYFASEKCEKNFSYNESIQAAVYAVTIVFTIILLIVTVVVVKKRNSLIIKSSSFPFCFCMLVFLIILSASSIFYAITPQITTSICNLRPWFTAFPLTAILAALLVKADRIRKIFSSKELVVQAITNAQLAKTMSIMLFIQLGILLWFSGSQISYSVIKLGSGSISGQIIQSCNDASNSWIIVQFLYIALLLFAGVVEAWGVRKVPSAFNEGPHIASTLLSLTVLLIILIPVQFMVSDNPNALIVIRGIGQVLVSTVMAFFLFGPKLYYILEGKENDKTMGSIGSSKSSSFSTSSKSSTASSPDSLNTQAFINLLKNISNALHDLKISGVKETSSIENSLNTLKSSLKSNDYQSLHNYLQNVLDFFKK